MSIPPVQSADPLDQLARTLFRNFDLNHDGKLSADEFSVLIAKLTGNFTSSAAGTGTSGAANATTPVLPSTASSRKVRAPLEGFDAGKIADLEHRTPKYIFARVARHTDLSGVTNKPTAESVLRSMVPELEAAGLHVLDVRGDKIQINHAGKDVWIDVIRGANSGSPAFQWLGIRA
jgi:hypothetical protein